VRFLATAVSALLSGFSVSAVHVVSPQLAAIGFSDTGGGSRSHVVVYDHGRVAPLRLPPLRRYDLIDDVWLGDRAHAWVVVWNVGNVRARLLRTSDGGATWRSVSISSHGAHAGARDIVQFLDRSHGRLLVLEPTGPDARLYETSDGGSRWRFVAHLPRTAPVVFETPTVAWLGGGDFGVPLERSVDGGRHWQRVMRSATLTSTPAFPGGVGLVAREIPRGNGIEISIERRGSSGWKPVSSLAVVHGCSPPSISFASPSAWWIADDHELFRTVDGGRRWSHAGSFASGGCSIAVDAASARVAWASVVRDRRTVVYLTADGGADWRAVR
jgi:hypothetical protein